MCEIATSIVQMTSNPSLPPEACAGRLVGFGRGVWRGCVLWTIGTWGITVVAIRASNVWYDLFGYGGVNFGFLGYRLLYLVWTIGTWSILVYSGHGAWTVWYDLFGYGVLNFDYSGYRLFDMDHWDLEYLVVAIVLLGKEYWSIGPSK